MNMTKFALLLTLTSGITSGLASTTLAQNDNLDALLIKVQQDQTSENSVNQQREIEFTSKKNEQQQLLDTTKKAVIKADLLNQQLQEQLLKNKEQLQLLNKQLTTKAGNLNEVFGVVRQVSEDIQQTLKHSVISTQYPERIENISEITAQKSLPDTATLKSLWFLMQQEMTESAKMQTFEQNVITGSGAKELLPITRIGTFTLSTGNQFLTVNNQQITELARQPDSKYTNVAAQYSKSTSSFIEAVVDPTQGARLNLYTAEPTIIERVQQGKSVGFVIIFLGVIGLVIALYRVVQLTMLGKKINRQQQNLDKLNDNNPLGRILNVYQEHFKEDTQALEIKLEEAILKEAPKLNAGIASIKLLAAVAPLLGLLGTVIGMIATFQAITLFGTGDPKLMAGGISSALVTTVLGLIVAVPLLFSHAIVQARSKALVLLLTQQSAGLLAKQVEQKHV